MIYRFSAFIYTEGGRAFIKIPFNLWDETGLKGNIPCRVSINGVYFECKLIPKGNGKYLIPVKNLGSVGLLWNILCIKGRLSQRWLIPIATVLHSK